ncbi:exportin-T-like [Babylonia areolata]|uniref:exportin-T-like n=1 Tax=Babylonia areolata TaxID=304850 RepID=UPI003FD680E3
MDDMALQGLGSVSDPDPQVRAQAMHHFEELKNSADGWKLCAHAYTSDSFKGNDHARFSFLKVCEHFLRTRYHQACTEEQSTLRAFLVSCLQQSGGEGGREASFMLNKLAQVVSLAFVVDYPSRWPSFFEDLLGLVNQGHRAVDLYLRVLQAIDQEVVDREIVHKEKTSTRNTSIKDHMRESCVASLAASWLHIMTVYEDSQPEVVCQCLDVVGRFVSWIDISLVANDPYVSALLRFLSKPLLRESCCDCIYEVLSKGMEPTAKLQMVESFFTVLDKNNVLSPAEDEESDFLAKLSKLMSGIGLALIDSWNKLYRSGNAPNDQAKVLAALETKIPYMLRFLADEDDDVSAAAGDMATAYINLLKTKGSPLSPTQRTHVEGMLFTVVKKMKYDESYNFEQDGEDEAMFDEYRKQLKVIFNNLAQLDADLVLTMVHNIVTQTLKQWKEADFRDVELAVSLLYGVAEAVPASHGQHFTGNSTKVSVLQDMMRTLMTSQVSQHGHTVVQLQFFETVVRYDRFFQVETEYIPECLRAFLDKRGLYHNSPKVRSRCSYLFTRIIKSLKAHLLPYVIDVFTQMQALLVLHSPDGANGVTHLLSADDQLFVYEAASILIISSTLPVEKKQELMKSLLAPIASRFESLLASLCVEVAEDRQVAYAKCICDAMGLASRVSKGFSFSQTMKACGCQDAFMQLLHLFGKALEAPWQRGQLQGGVRQYLHRMVVCLDAEVLPFIPPVLNHLLSHPEAKSLSDFMPLINQLIMKFKRGIIEFLSQIMMPLINTIFSILNAPVDERDQVTASDRKILKRAYYQFLSSIVAHECVDVFMTLTDLNDVSKVLTSVVQGVYEITDPTSQRSCFTILKKLTEAWGGDDRGLQGFVKFLYDQVVPVCITAPLHPSFDLKDGQTCLALGECASCLKTILDKRGMELINHLQEYLPTLNLSPEQSLEFCHALQTDLKTFKTYLKEFFIRAKS